MVAITVGVKVSCVAVERATPAKLPDLSKSDITNGSSQKHCVKINADVKTNALLKNVLISERLNNTAQIIKLAATGIIVPKIHGTEYNAKAKTIQTTALYTT